MASKSYKLLSILIIFSLGLVLFQHMTSKPQYVQSELETAALNKNNTDTPYNKKLITHADSLLSLKNPSVMDKGILPPSNDKHNYLSLSRYYWPNPKTKDSLPWILKDGKPNPYTITNDVDRKSLSSLTNSLHYLTIAYTITNDEKYAKKGISMLNTWFLDANTLMNPNLNHAQIIPGIKDPQRAGIIDGRMIPAVVIDAYLLFSKSRSWNPQYTIFMDAWFTEYLRWLKESPVGHYAASQINNQGTWYEFQLAALSLHLGKKFETQKTVTYTKSLIDKQFDSNGMQTLEIKRKDPFAYSWFNLEAWIRLAIIGEKVGVDLWNYQTKEGKSLQKAISFILNANNFNELYNKSSATTLSSLYFVMCYFQKNMTLTNKESTKVKEIFQNFNQRIQQTSFSKIFEHYHLIIPQLQ